jgi:CHASE2 domain-containing sensor protein
MNKNQRATPALFQREPAMVIGSIEAFLIAVVALVAFLLGWGGETVALVVGVVSAGIAVASSLVTRSKVASYAEVIAGD